MLEAFDGYWRKTPGVKRLVMKSIPDESTRAAALKAGEVDIAYLFGGTLAEELRRTPSLKVVGPLVYGVYWLDFLDQWEPKSPWHDRRVRLAASLAMDRQTINQIEMLGLGRTTGSFVPPEFDFALKSIRPPTIPSARSSSWSRRAIPNGFEAGDLTPLPPYTAWVRRWPTISRRSGSSRACGPWSARPSSRPGARRSCTGLVIGATGAAGNAAARLEPFVTKTGTYAYGTAPDLEDLYVRQSRELDRKQREALLHQLQKAVADRVLDRADLPAGLHLGRRTPRGGSRPRA